SITCWTDTSLPRRRSLCWRASILRKCSAGRWRRMSRATPENGWPPSWRIPARSPRTRRNWSGWSTRLCLSCSTGRRPTRRAVPLPGSCVRVHDDVDVGGSYGVKRGVKHAVLAGYLSRRLGFPVRLIEDRLENMRGGDAHGPERNFDIEVAFDDGGVIRSMKL